MVIRIKKNYVRDTAIITKGKKKKKREYLTHNLNSFPAVLNIFPTLSCLVNFFVLENETR